MPANAEVSMPADPDPTLLAIASELHALAAAWVEPTLSGGGDGAPPLLRELIRAQGVGDWTAFHLPEPLLGPVVRGKVLVLGFNPYLIRAARRPTLLWSFADYVEHCAARFETRNATGRVIGENLDGTWSVNDHFLKVEKLLEPAFGSCALGTLATYADAIPWKSANARNVPEVEGNAELQDAIRRRIDRLVKELRPRLVLALGKDLGARIYGHWPPPRVWTVAADGSPVTFVGCRHPADHGFYGALEATAAVVKEQSLKLGLV